jgi:uncharacterized protein (TIGR00730 family)
MKNSNIGVFCGARRGCRKEYIELGRDFGAALAKRGAGLVYEAGGVGIMGAVADAAFTGGARVTGIIPTHLYERERANWMPGEIFLVSSMHERKALMYNLSVGFAVLPGGFGTLDELLEVATWSQLGIHEKPIVLINAGGFFGPLLAMFDHLVTEGFLDPAERALVQTAPSTEAALDLIAPATQHDITSIAGPEVTTVVTLAVTT